MNIFLSYVKRSSSDIVTALFIVLATIFLMSCEKKPKDTADTTLKQESTENVEESKETVNEIESKQEAVALVEEKVTNDSFAPILKKNGQKWNIAYYEGGPFINYKNTLIAIVNGLQELGWISDLKYSITVGDNEEDSEPIWDWLGKKGISKYLNFSKDNYYSSNWDSAQEQEDVTQLMKRLKAGKVDFLIAAGTAAGKAFSNNQHRVPVMVVSTTNAVESEIIKSYEDSGFDHITARVDPKRWERQLKLFHTLIPFKRLGIAYENTPTGQTYATLSDVERVAEDNNFEVVKCYTKSDIPDKDEAYRSVLNCHKTLAPKVDAMFMTQQSGLIIPRMPELLKPFFDHNVPTISQTGSKHVKRGVLLGISRADFSEVGTYHAKVMAEILNGKSPRDIIQTFEESPKITINLATAKRIGFDPPVDILGASDEIYQEITK